MEEKGIARFPLPTQGRIPNFVGAERAAEKVLELKEFKDAKVVKSNPDSPQRPLRELCLKNGKTVYMAVPRLKEEKCFIELSPKKLKGMERYASTIRGAFKYGRSVLPEGMEKVDLIVAGCVAVNKYGAKVGKSSGYSDLEYALAKDYNLISENTPTITTVHPIQIVEQEIPMEKHDIPLDCIITPYEIIKTEQKYRKPRGIYWDILSEEKINSIPILKKLREKSFNYRN